MATPVRGPEQMPAYWNPNRVGAQAAPAWFQQRLREVDPEGFVDIRFNPILERWVAFYKKPNVAHALCQGWVVLMILQDPRDKAYMPLDERTLAALYNASGRKWGNGKTYFAAIEREMAREKERTQRKHLQDSKDMAMPFFEHSRISVAMRGKSSGSKFSTYHS